MDDLEVRKLKKVKISLMREPTFARLSGLMMAGTTTVVDNHPSAATDGYNEIYGRQFIKEHSPRELGFVVVHESGHKMFRHLTTWEKLWKEDRDLANKACDYVTNLFVTDMDPTESIISFPRDPVTNERMGCYDERFRGLNVKQVFDILKKERKGEGKGEGKGNGGGKDVGNGQGFDEHDWENANKPSPEEAQKIANEIDRAVRQGIALHEKLNGKGDGDLDRLLEELVAPKIDWKAELREFVTSTCTAKDTASYRKLNRRFVGLDIYLPILIGESLGSVTIAVDMSGSISREIPTFLTEMVSLLAMVKPEKVDLLYWGSHVAAHEVYTQDTLDTMLSNTKPKGGGGTSPSCVSKYMNTNKMQPECIVVFTDGEVGSDWGNRWPAPVLWVVVNPYRQIIAPDGKTIYIKELG